jgi:P pilus assembly chaperone PapD
MSVKDITVDFGNKNKYTEYVVLSNQGRTSLKISSLQLFTEGVKVTLNKRVLEPGESTKLKITANKDQLKKVRTKPRVLMITNDPDNAKVVLELNIK